MQVLILLVVVEHASTKAQTSAPTQATAQDSLQALAAQVLPRVRVAEVREERASEGSVAAAEPEVGFANWLDQKTLPTAVREVDAAD